MITVITISFCCCCFHIFSLCASVVFEHGKKKKKKKKTEFNYGMLAKRLWTGRRAGASPGSHRSPRDPFRYTQQRQQQRYLSLSMITAAALWPQKKMLRKRKLVFFFHRASGGKMRQRLIGRNDEKVSETWFQSEKGKADVLARLNRDDSQWKIVRRKKRNEIGGPPLLTARTSCALLPLRSVLITPVFSQMFFSFIASLTDTQSNAEEHQLQFSQS